MTRERVRQIVAGNLAIVRPGRGLSPYLVGDAMVKTGRVRSWRNSLDVAWKDLDASRLNIDARIRQSAHAIVVDNPEGRCRDVASATLDGRPIGPAAIPVVDDGGVHRVHVVLGAGMPALGPVLVG